MDVRSRWSFLLGAATNWLAFTATLAVSFLLTPTLIEALGPPRYDVWCVVESVLAYFTLLDLGVAAFLVRSVARARASHDLPAMTQATSAGLAIFLIAGAVALVLGLPVLFGLAPRLQARSPDGEVWPFMLLMLGNLAATLPLSVFPAILDGLERYTAKSLVRLGFLALRTAGILLVITTRPGLLPIAVVYTVTSLAEHAVLAGLCLWFVPGLRFRPWQVDRATLRQVRGYSGDAFLAMLAGRITVQTGAILVGLYLPAGQVTLFATAVRLVEYAKTLLRTITTTLTPGVSAMEARGDWVGIARLFRTATRWVLYAVIPVNLGLVFFGRPFLTRWVGADFADGSYPAMLILSLTLSIGVAQSVASRILYGLGRLRVFARLALVEAGVNLLLTLLLIQPLGVEGVAIAVALPNVLFCLAVIGIVQTLLGVSLRDYLGAVLRPVVMSAIPLAIWLAWGEVAATWPAIAGAILAGLVPYGLAITAIEYLGERLVLVSGPRSGERLVLVSGPRQGAVSDVEQHWADAGRSPNRLQAFSDRFRRHVPQ